MQTTEHSGFKTFLETDEFSYEDVNSNFKLLDTMRLPKPDTHVTDGETVTESTRTSYVSTSNAFVRTLEWKTVVYNDKWFESYGIMQVSGVTLPISAITIPKPDDINIKKLYNFEASFNATSAVSSTGASMSNTDLGVVAMPSASAINSVVDLDVSLLRVNCVDSLTISGQLFVTIKGEIS